MSDSNVIKTTNKEINFDGVDIESIEMIPPQLEEQLKVHSRNGKVANTMIISNGATIKVHDDETNGKKAKVYMHPLDEEEITMTNENNSDTLFQELKTDMRERESRTRDEINQREKRFEETLKSYQNDNKDREERFYQLVDGIKKENRDFKDDIKTELQLIRSEINTTKQDISNLTKHNESLVTTNKWAGIATIIGISAIVVTVLIAFITFFVALL